MTKKTYNPIRMLGSYIGLFGGLLLSYLSLKYFWYDYVDMKIAIERHFCAGIQECINHMIDVQGYIQMQYILYGFIGFLVGWGIHSLIRVIRK